MPSEFEILQKIDLDINEHLGTLRDLASECHHVTEMGVRFVVSSYAFLEGLSAGDRLISIDIQYPHEIGAQGTGRLEMFQAECKLKGLNFTFQRGDTTNMEIEETDLLFIDTIHTYEQLTKELLLHGNKARKYLVFHDTSSCPELNKAIDEFCEKNPHWKVKDVYENNNGLTVLTR